jgi:hypothetical protein
MTETTDDMNTCCAGCICTDPHSSIPATDVAYSEVFPTTETPTNCCVECTCPNPHKSKPPTEE